MTTDERLSLLNEWVEEQLNSTAQQVTPASSDASFRRYFRYHYPDTSYIAMDAPPDHEDCRPFVAIAKELHRGGLHVPQIIAQDLERGFLLLSDLGRQTYLEVITEDNSEQLFSDAIAALVAIQSIKPSIPLPEYDHALLSRELALFPDWYIDKHLQQALSSAERDTLQVLFDQLIEHALAQPQVLVHRDYMPRNLMISQPNPGVLDFQDAVMGPISYDPICLVKDAFLSWPEASCEQWLNQYWLAAQKAALPVPDSFQQFYYDCDLMGVHRHIKVIGIFARICHRDGKPKYLGDVPRFFNYLNSVSNRRPEFSALKNVLDLVASKGGVV